MRCLILGIDGFTGQSLSQSLALKGHEVAGIDNFSRRRWVKNMDSHSAIPIHSIETRIETMKELYGVDIKFYQGDLTDYYFLEGVIKDFKPECIVHLGEQPSAPFSMKSVHHAVFTQTNNVMGTLNLLFALHKTGSNAKVVKLGTLGEIGQPNISIKEDPIEITYKGRTDKFHFPKQAGSYYHLSKVHDTNNIIFACNTWKLGFTDIMQGVIYGTRHSDKITDPRLATRLDFDESFGTCLNRYCCQAVIGHYLTPYGKGTQKRGFIALRDSIQCLTLTIENPPEQGEYRVFNQYDEVATPNILAKKVKVAGKKHGLGVEIQNIENPRYEKEEHFYEVEHNKLRALGFKPTKTLDQELDIMLKDLMQHRERIESKKHVILPKIKWKQ